MEERGTCMIKKHYRKWKFWKEKHSMAIEDFRDFRYHYEGKQSLLRLGALLREQP
ncbi:hypothetical protein CEXT_623041, partial [Caerostris extrusa]